MVKRLAKSGNGYALFIDRAIMELLEITPDTPLKLTTNGKTLEITPLKDQITNSEVRAAADRFKSKFGGMMKRLAE